MYAIHIDVPYLLPVETHPMVALRDTVSSMLSRRTHTGQHRSIRGSVWSRPRNLNDNYAARMSHIPLHYRKKVKPSGDTTGDIHTGLDMDRDSHSITGLSVYWLVLGSLQHHDYV